MITNIKPPFLARLVILLIIQSLSAGCSSLPEGQGLRDQIKASGQAHQDTKGVTATRKIYVADFDLDARIIKTDPGIGGASDLVAQTGGILGRLAKKPLFANSMGSNNDEKAATIVSTMQEGLIKAIKSQGLDAAPLPKTSTALPLDGWLLKGQFLAIDEGNRLERSAIGFGQGATQMDLKVNVFDLRSDKPSLPFLTLTTVKDPGNRPGSAYNPYALAAKFRLEKNATEKDIELTAKSIVSELYKYRANFEAEAKNYPSTTNAETLKKADGKNLPVTGQP